MPANPDRIPRTPTRPRRAMAGIGLIFVPYTGALKDVDLGAFSLTTTGTITGEQIISTDDITMQGHLLTLGDGTATDIVISFSALTNDGTLTYDESADEFDFGASYLTAGYVNVTDQANGYQIDGVTMFAFSATENILIGENAGNSITTGDYNICIGKDAGTAITDGYQNICIGHETGKLITSGYKNTIVGYLAGIAITSGYDNVAIGKSAGERLTQGFENMILGTAAGAFITTGDRNTLIGFSAGQGIVEDNNNTFIGFQAGFSTFGGEDNTAIGRNAGRVNTTGNGNTWIGMRTGNILTGSSYSIAIGYHADATVSNQMVVGSVEGPIISIYLGEGVASASPQDLTINATGGSGEDVAAGDLIFAGGRSTGDADPGEILFRTTTVGASGSTLQTLSTRVRINETGIVVAANLDVVQSGTGHFTAGSEGYIVGTLTITDGSIVDSDGSITYGGTNFSSVGTIGCDTITLTANSDIEQSGTGHVTAGSEGFIVGNTTILDGSIDSTDGLIVFGDTDLTTTGVIAAGDLDVPNYSENRFRDLLLHLSGDGHANDISGYDADGTLGSTGFRTGVFGQAFDFNGTSEYVALDLTHIDPIISTGAFTMMGWAMLDVDVGGASNYLFDTDGRWILGVLTATDQMDMFISGSWRDPFDATFPIGRWVHFAVTRDGSGNLKGYYDGVLQNTVAGVTQSVGNMSTTATLGSKHDGSFDWWEGGCDEFQIFDRELGAEEVAAAHKLGRPNALVEDMDVSGDVVFRNDGTGLIFAEVYAHATADDITSEAINDWDQIVAFDTDGESNGATPDHTNDHITILTAGRYLVNFHWCGNGPNTVEDWALHISKNNMDTNFSNLGSHFTSPSTQKEVSVSGCGIVDLAVGDTIEMWVQRLSAGNNIVLTTMNCGITLTQIGGS
ncbi:hypothetical protein KAR91_56635 [Candidatus Pacearchaeota archaeon]|nr:hypothetical protein [Candidatus Pacearchaeota archaeon]